MTKCPKCGCSAYTKQGTVSVKHKGEETPVLKERRKCKYCGCKYTVNPRYRDNPPCIDCGYKRTRKLGFTKFGGRKYYCPKCGRNFQETYLKGKSPRISEYTKNKIKLYLRGGFSDHFIARMFKVGTTTVRRIRLKESEMSNE